MNFSATGHDPEYDLNLTAETTLNSTEISNTGTGSTASTDEILDESILPNSAFSEFRLHSNNTINTDSTGEQSLNDDEAEVNELLIENTFAFTNQHQF